MIEYKVRVHSNGSKYWYFNGELHREDGPAIELSNGTKCWFLNDERHRVDGPAIEWGNGSENWFLNGELHREDGPAVEYANGTKHWYLNGKKLTEEEFLKKIAPVKELTVAEISELLGYEVKVVKQSSKPDPLRHY